jgi:antitoxin ParD1/3/4
MATLNISLPRAMRAWIDARVDEGRFASGSDYVRDLIRRDQDEAAERARLVAALAAGRASGVSARGVAEIIGDERARFG